jgi:phosphatidylglycerol:prolipoprotein diacylglycerol transferase
MRAEENRAVRKPLLPATAADVSAPDILDGDMYPYIHIGSFSLGTFGLLLWLAAVCATVVLHKNFIRHNVDADALNIVALAVVFGILGAKLWHELQNPTMIGAELHAETVRAGGSALMGFFHWFQAGFAWFGGLIGGVLTLMWQGHIARFKGPNEATPGPRVGALRMLDLAAPAAAIGYGVGRIGCLTSGDGDYGIPTHLPWGVHMRPDALVPTPLLVQPTPIYELLYSILIFIVLWQLGKRYKPVGWLTGLYLILSAVGRFLVEFVRINPRLYWGMSNAQVAAILSGLVGVILMLYAIKRNEAWRRTAISAN